MKYTENNPSKHGFFVYPMNGGEYYTVFYGEVPTCKDFKTVKGAERYIDRRETQDFAA